MAGLLDFISFRDMFDGGGAGRSGAKFEGGGLSELLNSLGVRPMGYAPPTAQQRPMARPFMPAQAIPATPPQTRPANPFQPEIYGPGRVMSYPLDGHSRQNGTPRLTDEQLNRMLRYALQALEGRR